MIHRIRQPYPSDLLWVSTAALFLFVATVPAASTARAESAQASRFPRYVPQSARLFVSTAKLSDLEEALNRAHARELLPILTGIPIGGPRSFSISKVIKGFCGIQHRIAAEEVEALEVGLLARAPQNLADAVWLIRLPGGSTLDRWYPKNRRTSEGKRGEARFFETTAGVTVCYRDTVAAVARIWGPGSMMDQTMALMARPTGASMDRLPAFRDLGAYLPTGPLATVFFADDAPVVSSNTVASPFWPDIDRAAIGLYEGQGRLDVAIRASLGQPRHNPGITKVAIDRLMRLPQTTLFASVLTADPTQDFATNATSSSSGTLARYLALLGALQRTGDKATRTQLGPHLILAWGQDPHHDRETPQAVLMIESGNENAARETASRFAKKLIQLLGWLEPGRTVQPPAIENRSHLGVRIEHIPLAAYAKASKLPFLKLLHNTNPAWAVWGGWLVVALDHEHIERVLDAQFGLRPTLADVRDMQPLRRQSAQRSALAVLQADLVTQVLDRWITAAETGAPTLLDPSWWDGSISGKRIDPALMGIQLSNAPTDGAVVVAQASPHSPAARRLQPGDKILGVNGHLLSLHAAKEDLRNRLVDSKAAPGPTLRIQRDGKLQDIVLVASRRDTVRTNLRTKPADALRELAALGRTLAFSTFVVDATDPQHYSARLSLRFRATQEATGGN